MELLLGLLVSLVFLGTEILALPTPAFQLSPYRLVNFALWFVTIYKIYQNDSRLRIEMKNPATQVLGIYVFWWFWAVISITWAMSFEHWMRAIFLLTIGISTMIFIYFWTRDLQHWHRLIQYVWTAMSGLVIWGYFELMTNIYLLANLNKLDKYGTFASQPMTRIPITVFENQNDFATMLLAYLALTFIMIHREKRPWLNLSYYAWFLAASYLIYRSQSRMSVVALIGLLLVKYLLSFKWDIKKTMLFKAISIGGIILIFMIAVIEPLRNKLSELVYLGYGPDLSGDAVQLNLWRNGLEFLGQTFAMGVGAGNIEFWMKSFASLPVENIVNMHNWWLEILVAYGLPVFIAYTLGYFYMIYLLFMSRKSVNHQYRSINDSLIAFMIIFILASITSANNILIEWHWIIFGLIIAYVKLIYNHIKHLGNEEIR